MPGHVVLVGDNNSGKSSVIEAIDLALGPDRINRVAAIDEHDFSGVRPVIGLGHKPRANRILANVIPF